MTDQGVVMNTIEENTQQTDTQLESGNQQVETAISSARGARKKKWICLIISIIILIIIVVIVLKTVRYKGRLVTAAPPPRAVTNDSIW